MPEMPATSRADNLVSNHAVRGVAVNRNVFGIERPLKTRPSGPGLELGVRSKEWQVAEPTVVDAGLFVIEQAAAERPFGSLAEDHPLLLGRK